MRDLRDPTAVGEALLEEADLMRSTSFADYSFSECAEALSEFLDEAPDYQDETTIQKYGDPRKLPSTLPN